MNSVRFQNKRLIHRNLLYFYTIIMKHQKYKVKRYFCLKLYQKKTPSNKLNKGGERHIIKTIKYS